MNLNDARAVVFALIVVAMPPATAQAPAAPQPPLPANAPSPAPPAEPKPPVIAQGDASGGADARHCLDLATNLEVIACAEKYRSRKARR
jgi:hypothetical protein